MAQEYIERRGSGYYFMRSRVSLDSIVYQFVQGESPEAIVQAFPSLSLEQIYGGITFYLAHRAEMDAYLEVGRVSVRGTGPSVTRCQSAPVRQARSSQTHYARARLMRPRFQADEDLNAKLIAGIRRREPSIDFQTAKVANLFGLSDTEVLLVAGREGRIVVSHDRETMPTHFSRFIEESTSAGLLVVSQKLGIREAIEQILIVWSASEADEWITSALSAAV